MNKNYLKLSAVAVALIGQAYAQSPVVKKDVFQAQLGNSLFAGDRFDINTGNTNSNDRVAFWTEDFGSGMNSVNGMWTTDGVNGNIWAIVPTITGACYTNASTPSFTSAANGFALFYADSANCTNPTGPVFAANDFTGALVSPVIDLSTENSVVVSWEDNLRHCCSGSFEIYLSASNDGGTTWTDFNVLDGLAANDPSGNPRNMSVNISSVAANQANVKIKFQWNANQAYYWAIDDISLDEAENFDLKINEEIWGSNGPGLGGIVPYYQIPTSQTTDIVFSSFVNNQGKLDQGDVVMNVDINSGATMLSSASFNLPSGATDSLFTTTNFTPSTTGTYDFDVTLASTIVDQVESLDASTLVAGSGYTTTLNVPTTGGTGTGLTVDVTETAGAVTAVVVNQTGTGYAVGDVITIADGNNDATIEVLTVTDDVVDDTPMNNTFSNSFEVTDFVYARDNGIEDGGSYNQGDAYEVGNGFDMFGNATLYSIEVSLSDLGDASLGPILTYAVLYGLDQAGNFEYIAGSQEITITQAMIDNEETISYPFPGGISLTDGEFYLPVVGSYGNGGNNNELVIQTGGESDVSTTFLYDPNESGGTWYYTTSTPMIRMNFDETTSVDENEISDFTVGQNIPNPFNNNSYINYSLNEASNVNFTVVDMTGKIVMDVNQGTQAAGEHRINLSADKFAEGVYFYSFTIGDKKVTKKMVVTK